MSEKKKEKAKETSAISDQQRFLHKNLNFTASEQYKLLRTNLQFALPDVDKKKCRIIGVSSSMRCDGKSTTSVNLSYSLAETGKNVLLIDGDLRLPSIAKKMDISNTPGLSNMLIDFDISNLSMYKSNQLDNWFILPSGDIPPNPSELLGSAKMGKLLELLSERFDYIIVDLPPINIVSDGLVISPYIDGMVIVIREGYTERKELSSCVRQLELSNVKLIGFVLNVVRDGHGGYGRYKKYYKSRHYSKYYNKYYNKYYKH